MPEKRRVVLENMMNEQNRFSVFPIGMLGSERIVLCVRNTILARLGTTCFRGAAVAKAGNFFRWNNFCDLWRNTYSALESALVPAVRKHAEAPEAYGPHERITISCPHSVGWDSTISIDEFTDEEIGDLEIFSPNEQSTALRVKLSARRLAPVTNLVTFVFHLRHDLSDMKWAAFLLSIYPGKDIGPLEGDISSRDGFIFFSLENPGEIPTS